MQNSFYLISLRGIFIYGAGIFNVQNVIGKFISFYLSKIVVHVWNSFYLTSLRGIFIYGVGFFNVQKVIGKFFFFFLSKIVVHVWN